MTNAWSPSYVVKLSLSSQWGLVENSDITQKIIKEVMFRKGMQKALLGT